MWPVWVYEYKYAVGNEGAVWKLPGHGRTMFGKNWSKLKARWHKPIEQLSKINHNHISIIPRTKKCEAVL